MMVRKNREYRMKSGYALKAGPRTGYAITGPDIPAPHLPAQPARKKMDSAVERRLVHTEEVQGVLTVLDRGIVGPDMREALEPYEPGTVDPPGHPY
jgi:hypothetical protein